MRTSYSPFEEVFIYSANAALIFTTPLMPHFCYLIFYRVVVFDTISASNICSGRFPNDIYLLIWQNSLILYCGSVCTEC